MTIRRRSICLLIAVLAMPLWGLAAPPSPPDAAPTERPSTPSSETVRVALAQFDVVVRYSKGQIISGLTSRDFEVSENGVLLEVEAVDEWGAATAASPASNASQPPMAADAAPPQPASPPAASPSRVGVERRSIVFLFDGLNTSTALKMSQIKKAAVSFARRHLGPDDLAAVYQVDMTLRALSGVTGDPAEVVRAIERVAWMPSSTFAEDVTESVLAYRSNAGIDYMPSRLTAGALLHSQVIDWQREHIYKTMDSLGSVFEGLPGKHILVFLSAGFPMTTPGDIYKDQGGFTPAFRDLVRTLSRNGVTVYSIDLGDDLSIGDASRPIDWRIAVGKIGMEESALSDLGLDRDFSFGSAGSRREGLGVMAGETGGQLLTHGDFNRAFEIIQEESTRFYRISCKVPEARGQLRYSKVVIRVKRPDAKVSARRGRYGDVVPGSTALAETNAGDRLVESLDRYRSIVVRGSTGVLPFPDPDGAFPVVVVAEAVGPLEYTGDAKGGASVDLDYFIVARAGDQVIRSSSKNLKATVKPEGTGSLRRTFRLEGRVSLRPGAYQLQAIVRIAAPPQYGSWTTTLIVPQMSPTDGSLHLAGLFLLPPGNEESPLLLKPELASGQSDPLVLSTGMRVLPATQREYPSAGELLGLFWLRGLVVPEGGAPDLEITVKVLDAQGVERVTPSRLLVFQPAGPGAHRGLVGIDLSSLDAGSYLLRVQARHRADTTNPAEAKATFQVVPARATGTPTAAAGSG
jgi:VWFA-related protein